jgi:hypothetical protein
VPISPIKRAPTRLCGRASRQVGAEDRVGLPFDGFKEELRNPANDMPAYSEAVLSDKDISTSTRSWSRCQARGRRRTSRSSTI